MKKLKLFLFIFVLFLIPKISFALSDSNYFEIVDYGILGGSNRSGQTLYQIYSTSNDYIKSLIEDNSSTPYHTFYLKHLSTTSSYIHYQFYMYFSDSELTLSSCIRSANSNYFFEITYRGIYSASQTWEFGVKPDKLYTFDFYLNLQNNKYYNNSTFTDANLFTSFENLNPTITTSFGRIQGTSYTNEGYLTDRVINHAGSATGTSSLELYSNNNSLSYCYLSFYPSGTDYSKSRGIRYVNSSGELIAEYNVGDVVDGYYEMYFSKPQYLNGYKKITIDEGQQYYLLSGITSGSVFIPYAYWNELKSTISYFNSSLEYQPYEANIIDYRIMPDGLYVKQDFNLDSYNGADAILFQKYSYLEGIDDYSFDIYVPDDSYGSDIEVVENNQGSNDFIFTIYDDNGVGANITIVGPDLTQNNPLLNDLINSFGANSFGLESIIIAPLNLINQLTSFTCSNLVLPIPFINEDLTLPCMSSLYSSYFGDLFDIYQLIITGLISYWILIDMFNMIKNFKDPNKNEIGVMDL